MGGFGGLEKKQKKSKEKTKNKIFYVVLIRRI